MDSPHNGPVIGKEFPCHEIIKSEAAPELNTNILSSSVIHINVSKHFGQKKNNIFPNNNAKCSMQMKALINANLDQM